MFAACSVMDQKIWGILLLQNNQILHKSHLFPLQGPSSTITSKLTNQSVQVQSSEKYVLGDGSQGCFQADIQRTTCVQISALSPLWVVYLSLELPCPLQRSIESMPSLWYLLATRRSRKSIPLTLLGFPQIFKLKELTKSTKHRRRQASMNESQQKQLTTDLDSQILHILDLLESEYRKPIHDIFK